MRGMSWFALCLVCSFLLVACNGTSTPQITEQPCIIGTWRLADGAPYFTATIPQGAFEMGALKYKGGAGVITYTFKDDASLVMQAKEVMVRLDARSGPDLYALDLKMDGFASASYTIEDDLVKVGGLGNSDIHFVVNIGSDEMMNTKSVGDFAPLFKSPFTTARFQCSSDRLTLEILNLPGAQQPILFIRVQT